MMWDEINNRIAMAAQAGQILDWRHTLPWNAHYHGQWPHTRTPDDIVGICIHHSASQNQHIERVNDYHIGPNHISPRGCPHICYTWVVSNEHDAPVLCNPPEGISWAQGDPSKAGDENKHLVSICVLGNFKGPANRGDAEQPTQRQWQALSVAAHLTREWFHLSNRGTFGHADFKKPQCPGDALYFWVRAQRAKVMGLADAAAWQHALVNDDPTCLPRFGIDGTWGEEAKAALVAYQRKHGLELTACRDPFTELYMLTHG
jgi:hypothetical protein